MVPMLCAVSLKAMTGVAVIARGDNSVVGRLRGAFSELNQFDDSLVVGPSSLDFFTYVEFGEAHDLYSTVVILDAPIDKVLSARCIAGVTHIVFVSSAMVYGAWPNNPVPITESALLRPSNTFEFATQCVLAEEALTAWRAESSERKVCVLRPALSLAAKGTPRVVSTLAAGVGLRAGEDDPPAQFLHLDDLASAIALVTESKVDGIFNVAPDGWISGEVMRGLASTPTRLRLPGHVADLVSHVRWIVQRGPLPPGLRDYTRWPWVVSNDALRALGWQPSITNEQAYVEGTQTPWYSMVSPKRKQELLLGVSALLLLTSLTAIVRRIIRSR